MLLRTDGVDRGIADPMNIICIILEKNVLFKLGCEVGTLNTMFPFNVIVFLVLGMVKVYLSAIVRLKSALQVSVLVEKQIKFAIQDAMLAI